MPAPDAASALLSGVLIAGEALERTREAVFNGEIPADQRVWTLSALNSEVEIAVARGDALRPWLAPLAANFTLLLVLVAPRVAGRNLDPQADFLLDYFFAPEVDQAWIDELIAFDNQVGLEDRGLVEGVQRGVRSGILAEGPLLSESEQLVAHFQRLCAEALTR